MHLPFYTIIVKILMICIHLEKYICIYEVAYTVQARWICWLQPTLGVDHVTWTEAWSYIFKWRSGYLKRFRLSKFVAYCNIWKLSVNVEKTKIVIFGKSKWKGKQIFKYDGKIITVEDT